MSDDSDELRIELKDDKPDKPKKGSRVKYDEDEPNLVETFMKSDAGRRWLKKICARVVQDFDQDFESTEEYRKRFADDFKIFAGDLPKKDYPYKGCANAHLPYMLENLSRLQFRAASELFGNWKQPFGVVRVGTTPIEDEIVDVLTVHGNWQIREQMPDFRRQVADRGLLLYFCAGDVTCHSFYDSVRKRNCHEMLTCDDFVAPYVYVTTQPDYSDLPHHTKILRRYRHELQAMRGEWFGINKVLRREPPGWDDEPETKLRDAIAEVEGTEQPDDQKGAPYKILEYEGWLEMPPSQQDTGSKAEPRDRFVQVRVDHATGNPLSLCIYEEPPWQEKERFQRQTAELEQFNAALEQYQAAMAQSEQQLQGIQQQMATGAIDPMAAEQQLGMMQQQSAAMQPPLPPDWLEGQDPQMAQPEPMRKEPIHLYSHGVCIESLRGNLGLSYGRIQADYNRAADTSLSQFIDAATLGNVWSLVTDNTVQFEDGFEISPGSINKATGFTGKLEDHIMQLKPGPANPQLFDIVRFMSEVSQSAIQAPNVLSGEPGKSGETYRGIATRIEQATKQLTYATQKYGQFVKQILKNNARLNAAFLPEEEMRYLMDYKLQTLRYIKVERRLYDRNYDVEFESDLAYSPQAQRIASADEVTQMALSTPVLQQNLAFCYEALKKSLEARDRQDLVPLLGKPPPIPPMFGLPSFPPPPPQPGAPGQPAQPGQPPHAMPGPPQGQHNGETPASGGGMRGPSPGVASGPKPAPPQQHPPGPGGPINAPS